MLTKPIQDWTQCRSEDLLIRLLNCPKTEFATLLFARRGSSTVTIALKLDCLTGRQHRHHVCKHL